MKQVHTKETETNEMKRSVDTVNLTDPLVQFLFIIFIFSNLYKLYLLFLFHFHVVIVSVLKSHQILTPNHS